MNESSVISAQIFTSGDETETDDAAHQRELTLISCCERKSSLQFGSNVGFPSVD